MNYAMGSDQWLLFSIYIILPALLVVGLAMSLVMRSRWLSRAFAVVLLAFIAWSAVYYGIGSVLTWYGVVMVVLALGLLVRSTGQANPRSRD